MARMPGCVDAAARERQWLAAMTRGRRIKRVVRLLGAGALALLGAAATAGPPYAADDPEPTDTGHWEIYAFGAGAADHGMVEGAAGLDLNYGPAPNVQLTATLPLDYAFDGRTRAGTGDVELGLKYRFLHDARAGFSIAIFPRVILPTAGHRFGTGRAQLLLPVWAQRNFGPWSLFGGGGYTLNPGAGNRNFWQGGLALTRTVNPRLSLGAELAYQGPDEAGARGTLAVHGGGIYRLGGPFSLLLSGGPDFARGGGTSADFYAALGLNF